jgi:hypothetical protein
MKIYKILAILALICWLSIAVMAYVNIWVKTEVVSTSTQWSQDYKQGSNFSYNDDGSSGPWMREYYNTTVLQVNDVFPHEQMLSTMWFTLIPSIVMTVMAAITWDAQTEIQIKNKEQEKP